MKKFFLLFLCGGILFSCSNEEKMSKLDVDAHNVTKDAMIEEDAYQLYEDLQSSLVKTRSLNASYPDNYGGSYLDSNGEFVVLIVEGQETKNLNFVPKGAVTKPCKYSYNELLNVLDVLTEYKLSDNREIYNNFLVFYIDDKQNRIIVELTDFSENAKQAFRENVSNSETIIFVEASVKYELPVIPSGNSNSEEIEYKPSCAIETRAANYPFLAGAPFGNISIGYRAKKDGKIGLVTCGHSNALGKTFTVNGQTIGKITAWMYKGTVDASFIEITNSDYEGSNQLYKYPGSTASGEISPDIKEYGVGFTVNKIGQTTQRTWGEIYTTTARIKDKDEAIEFYPMTGTRYNSAGGDSGGIVYSYVSSTDTRYTVGIHKGSMLDASGNKCSFYVKANDIKNALNVTRY